MSNKYTEHFQLSQWEKADKVLMEDFNADNVKIDAALAGKADASALSRRWPGTRRTWLGRATAVFGPPPTWGAAT